MPELPEVETTRRGISPWLAGHRIDTVLIRDGRLRWPIRSDVAQGLVGSRIDAVDRRAKYLLLRTARGTALLHLGMSGSLRVVRADKPPGPYDHFDIVTDASMAIRFSDPRRFGSLHWTSADPATHPLLASLGPEPLTAAFNGAYLAARSRRRKVAIKQHLMNAHVVVGVGNIYASESLHRAAIHPARPAGRISAARFELLANAVKEVLTDAIRAGGTTIRDFYDGDGKPGYFRHELRVYERDQLPCFACGTPIRHTVTGQRSTYYCPRCQR